MFNSIYFLLPLLFVKHWYVDFINQSTEEIHGKGIYGNAYGVMHSIKHGVATFLIFWWFLTNWPLAVIIGFMDFVIHYHIDWAKQNINRHWNYTPENPKFWAWFGADQLAHSLTYIFLVWVVV
jgi:hypothetical protein